MPTLTNGNGNGNGNGNEHRLEAKLMELTARLDGLNNETDVRFEGVVALGAERDRRYEQRFATAEVAVAAALVSAQGGVAAALSAQKEATAAAFAASEKAIVKAELAAESRSNSIEVKIEDVKEVRDRNDKELGEQRERGDKELREEIQGLRESRSMEEGAAGRDVSDHLQTNWVIGVAIVIVGMIIGLLEFILRATGH